MIRRIISIGNVIVNGFGCIYRTKKKNASVSVFGFGFGKDRTKLEHDAEQIDLQLAEFDSTGSLQYRVE